jgi:hypothetical protein
VYVLVVTASLHSSFYRLGFDPTDLTRYTKHFLGLVLLYGDDLCTSAWRERGKAMRERAEELHTKGFSESREYPDPFIHGIAEKDDLLGN